MKNIFLTIGIFLLSFGNAFAQTNSFDKKLQKIDQTKLTSGIIYDRVLPLADLGIYNMPSEKPHNTADFRFFQQALLELYKASNYKKLISIKELEEKIIPYNREMNVVPIGIINSPFQSLNYNPENPKEGGLILKDSLFVQIPEKEPFLNGYALVVAPLKNVMQGEQIVFKFSNNLIFNNGNTKIKTLIADFGDGKKYKIFEEGKLINREIKIENFKDNGDKTFHFTVTLSNNFTFNTNGKIYTVYGNPSNNSLNTQPIACSNGIADPNGLIENFKVNYTEATDSFQGLNETLALKGQIEPRVFYHTNNGNTQKTMLKPILIIDGFDPSDTRKIDDCDCDRDPICQEAHKNPVTKVYGPDEHTSFVESMKYIDDSTTPVLQKNLITVLREKGYDVILVNQPSYEVVHPTIPTRDITIPAEYDSDGNLITAEYTITVPNLISVDGGADFIERNAMAFVQLVKEVNTKLQTNGSTEKLVVMGPSMGGQISRYALAYMEKKFAETGLATWQHNTRIWVAFDSPNHGANVPLGDQALIKMLADADNIAAAKKSFKKLQTIASNEMLINYLQSNPAIDNQISNYHNFSVDLDSNYTNASTISQGMPNNTGNPYFKEHFNNQFNNGLPNSNGFPMNLRKLSIVNGSLTGETFGNGYEKILDVKLRKRICLINWNIFGWQVSSCNSMDLFQAAVTSMPTTNNPIAGTWKFNLSGGDTHIINSYANSVRGNLDNVPGGAIDATGLLHSEITGAPAPGARSFWEYMFDSATSFFYNHIGNTPEWETRVNKPNQCFIPTYSGIGIKNPNQSWSNPLNRNLVCSNETYFDSFFGESNNTTHVSLNYRSVNWLLKELGDNDNPPTPQAPHFPIPANTLTGPDLVCTTANSFFSLGSLCKIPSPAVWTVTPPTALQIISQNGTDLVVKGLTNGPATITAKFQNGMKVDKTLWVGKPSFALEHYYFEPQPVKSTLCASSDIPNFTLAQQGVTNIIFKRGTTILPNYLTYCHRTTFPECIEVTAINNCGSTTVKYQCEFLRTAQNTNIYSIYPNPSKDIVNIELRNQENQPQKDAKISGELFDLMGLSTSKVQINNNQATFSVQGLRKGIYILKIYINDQTETHQIAVE